MVAASQNPQRERWITPRHFSSATTTTISSTTAFLLLFVSLSLLLTTAHGQNHGCYCGSHQSLSKALSDIPNYPIGEGEDGDRLSVILVHVEGEVRTVRTRKNENRFTYTNATVLRDYQDCDSISNYRNFELLSNESRSKVEKASTIFVKTSNSRDRCGQPLVDGRDYLLFGKRRNRQNHYIEGEDNVGKGDVSSMVTILKTHLCYKNLKAKRLRENQFAMLEDKHKEICLSHGPAKKNGDRDSSSSMPSLCSLPSKIGRCRASLPHWFYNTSTQQCQIFHYGGCDGNDNRFDSKEECQKVCQN